MKGFTLAETLITLGIIGVVAAITIPTISKWYENSYKTQYREIFSELNQALRLLEEDGASPLTTCNSMDDNCFRDAFAKKIKITHKCNGSVPNPCQKTSKLLDNTTNYRDKIAVNVQWPSFVTVKGYSVKFRFHYQGCSTTTNDITKYNYGTLDSCGWVQVDTNGLSGPNTEGKDIFHLLLLPNGFVPLYISDDKVKDCYEGTGISCASLYINNSGKIKLYN